MKIEILILSIIFSSCISNSDSVKKEPNKYYPTYTKNLEDSIQVIELSYISWACTCANWATPSDISKYEDTGKLSDQCVFIEPIQKNLELPDTLGYSGDLIKFTGQFYKEKGYPKYYLKTEESVEKAKVFRYTKYEIIKSNYSEIYR